MRGFVGILVGFCAASSILVLGCEDAPKIVVVPDAGPPPPAPLPPPREGCARTGSLEGIESDPACAARAPTEEAARAALKQVAISVTVEPPEVLAGGTALLKVVIKNTSPNEVTLWFESKTRSAGPRFDWARVAGVPEPHAAYPDAPRLFFAMTTTDPHDRDVDSMPTVSAGSTIVPPQPTPLAVHLRAGGKLTHVVAWWALRIPAPAPVVQDDAGHRFYPKTMAYPLAPGEYGVALDLPLHALSREERKQAVRINVLPSAFPDGGLRRH